MLQFWRPVIIVNDAIRRSRFGLEKLGTLADYPAETQSPAFSMSRREIELTIDRGKLEAGRHSVPICEIELELKSGQSAELFNIARTLAKEIPLQLVVKSKAERGYAVLTGEKLKGVKAARVAVSPDISRQVAFQLIARACLYQLAANQPAMQGGDPEGVQ